MDGMRFTKSKHWRGARDAAHCLEIAFAGENH
jgi:hypothetical protein